MGSVGDIHHGRVLVIGHLGNSVVGRCQRILGTQDQQNFTVKLLQSVHGYAAGGQALLAGHAVQQDGAGQILAALSGNDLGGHSAHALTPHINAVSINIGLGLDEIQSSIGLGNIGLQVGAAAGVVGAAAGAVLAGNTADVIGVADVAGFRQGRGVVGIVDISVDTGAVSHQNGGIGLGIVKVSRIVHSAEDLVQTVRTVEPGHHGIAVKGLIKGSCTAPLRIIGHVAFHSRVNDRLGRFCR